MPAQFSNNDSNAAEALHGFSNDAYVSCTPPPSPSTCLHKVEDPHSSLASTASTSVSDIPSPPSSGSTSFDLQLRTSSTYALILEALAKFQACLFVLSNSVISLHDSLRQILPGYQASPVEATGNCPSYDNMMETQIRPIVRKLSQSKIFENNNSKVFFEKDKHDTVVSVNSDDKESTEKSGFKYAGILLALFASVCMSLVTLVVKFMEGYHPVTKVVWRLQGVLLPSMMLVGYVKCYQKKQLIIPRKADEGRPGYWKCKIFSLLVIRGVVGCSADIFQYYSLKYLPLADSTVISFSTPIFVCIVAHFVLKERCGVVPIFTAILTLCGVIVICKPPILTGGEEMSEAILMGNLLAILCMICNTLTTVIMRYLQDVHFSLTMLALGVFGTIEGVLVTLITSPLELPRPNSSDWLLAVIIAGLFCIGQLALTLALQIEEAGVVSLCRTTDVLMSFVWQVNFLHQEANIFSYIGAFIVTLGVSVTGVRKWVFELPENHPMRNRFGFILR